MPDDWEAPFRELLKAMQTAFGQMAEGQKALALQTAKRLAELQDETNEKQAELFKALVTAQREIVDIIAETREALKKLSSRLDDLERRLADH